MELSKERIAWLRGVLKTAEYCHIGAWGGDVTWDVQGDLEDALDDIAQLEAENDEESRLRKRLSDLLEQTANALKGKPEPLHLHDWADLPEVARKLVADNRRLRGKKICCVHCARKYFLTPDGQKFVEALTDEDRERMKALGGE